MLISIIGIIVVLGVIIFFHEMGHFLMAKRMGVKVEVFSLGFGPKLWSVKKGGTEYKVCLMPFGGYVKQAGEEAGDEHTGAEWEFCSKPVGKRFNILVSGAAVNYILGFILLCLVFMLGAPVPTSRIGAVLDGYPAEKIGLQKDDRIIAIGGEEIEYWEDVLKLIRDKKGEDINLTVDRNGKILTFNVSGRPEEQKDIFGRPIRVTMIGIAPSDETINVKSGFFESVKKGAGMTWSITALTYKGIWHMLTGGISIKNASGPIGIFAMTAEAAQRGIMHLLWIMAILNIAIAIFNLLPFPPLDGGHVIFLGIEKLKGSPVSMKVQDAVMRVGWTLLIMLLIVVSWNDIMRYF